jgi:integrase
MARLQEESDPRKTMAAAFLQVLLLSMVRFDEARAAQWSEFDFEAKTWTIPAQRMKARKEHTIPLSSQVIATLQSLSRAPEYVFPGKSAKIIGRAVIERYWDDLRQTIGQPTATMHATGRSTSATWFQEQGHDQTMIDRCASPTLSAVL